MDHQPNSQPLLTTAGAVADASETELRRTILDTASRDLRVAALTELVRRLRPSQHGYSIQGYVEIDNDEDEKFMIGSRSVLDEIRDQLVGLREIRNGPPKVRITVSLVQ